MTLRHMTRVKAIKIEGTKLYVIPYDMTEKFFELIEQKPFVEEEFNRVFSEYRYRHIDEAELYIKKSNLYP